LTLLTLPSETDSWIQVSQDRQLSAEIQETLGTTNHVSRFYQKKQPDGKGIRVELHAAYYTGMIDTVPHVPDRCFVGAGMDLTGEAGEIPLTLDTSTWREDVNVPDHRKGQIHKMRSQRGEVVRLPRDAAKTRLRTMTFGSPGSDRETYAGYFFVANGGTVARAEGVRLLAFNLDDYYAYYLKVQFTCTEAENLEEFAQAASSLLSEMYPELMRCVPDWVEVERGTYPAGNPIGRTSETEKRE
jgi:hypothetical protein